MKLSLVFFGLGFLVFTSGCGSRSSLRAANTPNDTTSSATTSSTTAPAATPSSSITNPFTGAPSSPNAFAVEAAHASLSATINGGAADWSGGEAAWLQVSSAASRLANSKGVPFCAPVESNGNTQKALLACAMRAAKATVNFAQLNAFIGNGGSNEINCNNGLVLNSAASRFARASGYPGARIAEWDKVADQIFIVAVPPDIGVRVRVPLVTLRQYFPSLPDTFSCPYLLPMHAAMQRYCKASGYAGGFADEWNGVESYLEGVCLRP